MSIAPKPLLISLLVITLGPSFFWVAIILKDVKPFQDYAQLLASLQARGMEIPNPDYALRKLSQVGYYRLSGFWYICRKANTDSHSTNKRLDEFLLNTQFNEIFRLYLFDKRLRLLFLDAIERIEVSLKAFLAHELGKIDALAYKNPKFINPQQLTDYQQQDKVRNAWDEWSKRQESELKRCKEDYIKWHNKTKRPIPIWVAVEAWSFGTVSKYFEMLRRTHQNKIAQQLGVSNTSYLVRWLQAINVLRNRCAHHSRLWNQTEFNPLNLPKGSSEDALFFEGFGKFVKSERARVFVLGLIIWYLVRKIGPSSDWFSKFCAELKNIPSLPIDIHAAMGIPKPLAEKLFDNSI